MVRSYRLLVILIALLLPTLVFSQIFKEKQIGFSIGLQGKSCDNAPSTSQLNFLNYLDTDNFTGNYTYLAFTGNFKFSNQYYLNMVVGMYSDLAPVKYNFAFSYIPWRYIGFGISFLGYPEYINEITQFHWNNHEGMYGSINTNYWQKRNYNMGFAAGPEIKYQHKALSFNFRLHAGVRWVKRFDTRIGQKEEYGNYRRVFVYKIGNNLNSYVLPEFELKINMFSISKSQVGLKLRTSGEVSNRTLNYQQTTYEWTALNSTNNKVSLPKHFYSALEFDLGFFIKW